MGGGGGLRWGIYGHPSTQLTHTHSHTGAATFLSTRWWQWTTAQPGTTDYNTHKTQEQDGGISYGGVSMQRLSFSRHRDSQFTSWRKDSHESIDQCKTTVSPVHKHWRYCSLALNQRSYVYNWDSYTDMKLLHQDGPHCLLAGHKCGRTVPDFFKSQTSCCVHMNCLSKLVCEPQHSSVATHWLVTRRHHCSAYPLEWCLPR